MKIPEPMHSIAARIDRWHEEKPEYKRTHLGCSEIGEPCARRIWYSYHEGIRENFSGRMLRLFRHGQMTEDVVCQDLMAAGFQVTGRQRRVDFGNNFYGSIDGIIDEKYLLEIKTHNQKSFDELLKKGVKDAKPEHYVQMQCYMLGTGLEKAVYFAVNKNTEEIYTEKVYFDRGVAEDTVRKAHDIIEAKFPPKRISDNPSWYSCKFCPAHDRCHHGA